jgi:glycosyltransferase involved in cell wall biosynthesis
MRILQLGRFYPPDLGGIETVIFEVAEGLNTNNIVCDVLCSNKVNKLDISKVGKYKVIRAPSLTHILSTSISPLLILQLRKVINDYDIIHLHHPDPMATLALLACRPRQKIVVHWHSDIVRQKFALFFYRPVQEMLLKRCDKVIVTSQNYLDTSQHLEKYKSKAVVIPIGINAEMSSNQQKLDALKSKFGNKKIIFSLGRHVYYKGFEYLIDSTLYLTDDFVVIIGGDGPLTASLKQQAISKGLESKVVFTGKIPFSEIHSYFELCDIFCLSSIERSEAFGVVLLEAMSLSKPLVTTNIPGSGANWVNQHNETGLNVPPQNAEALAKAFIKISSDQTLREKFSRQSKARYQNNFTRQAMVDQLVALYSGVLQN